MRCPNKPGMVITEKETRDAEDLKLGEWKYLKSGQIKELIKQTNVLFCDKIAISNKERNEQ